MGISNGQYTCRMDTILVGVAFSGHTVSVLGAVQPGHFPHLQASQMGVQINRNMFKSRIILEVA